MRKKKICVIFTGGTIGSMVSDGYISPNEKSKSLLISMFEEYSDSAGDVEFDTTNPYWILSENLSGKYLNLLMNEIKTQMDKGCYDGIIVTHGTDTLQYSAAAASLIFGKDVIPVMFVSSQYPLTDKRANGLNNFICAVDYIIQKNPGGVYVSYQNDGGLASVYPAGLLQKHMAFSHDIYIISFDEECTQPEDGENQSKWKDFPYFEDKSPVLFLEPYPGMTYTLPEGKNIRAVLLGSFHSGTIATGTEDLKEFCMACRQRNIPVYLVGSEGGVSYESTREYEALGIRPLHKVAPVTAYMMLWLQFSRASQNQV